MKTGLVLEGGGLRGIFSAGVLDVLMEEGVKFDGAAGVSAGAAFGSNYKSGQNRRAIRYNLRFAKDPRYSSVMSLIATGNLFNAQFCYHDIPEKLDPFDWEAFRRNPMEFYLVCTDVETGKPVYHLCDNDSEQEMLEWFRASGSMPLVSRVVEIGGQKLLDGGISDSIPLRFMEEQGYQRNIVVLTQPADFVKTLNPLMGMVERGLRSYPNAVEAIRNRHIVYNEELAYVRQRESGKQAFVIRPDHALDIGRIEHDRMKIRAAYKAGRRKARKLLPEILRFLEGAKAVETGINASMVEEDVKVTDVVKPSLVEDPALVSGAGGEEGFGKTYEETPEEISGRENKDVPEELQGKIDRDASEGIIEEQEWDVPTAATSPEGAEAADTEAEAAAAAASGVTSASLVESEPIDTDQEEDDSSKERVQEVRAVLLPEEEEMPAFQRPFPMGREMDEPVYAEEETSDAQAVPGEEEGTAEAEAVEAEVEEAQAQTVEAEAEEAEAETVEAGAEEGEAETVEAEAEEGEAETVEAGAEEGEAETVEAEAEEAETEAAEAEAETAKAEEAETESAEAEIVETETEEPVAEESAAEEIAAEEPVAEKSAAEAFAEEEPAEEEPAAEEIAAEEPVAEEPAAEEAAEETKEAEAEAETAEPAAEETAVSADDSETPAEPAGGEETSGPNPVSYRKKTRKQKKVWKPGNMTALKEKAKAEDQK